MGAEYRLLSRVDLLISFLDFGGLIVTTEKQPDELWYGLQERLTNVIAPGIFVSAHLHLKVGVGAQFFPAQQHLFTNASHRLWRFSFVVAPLSFY